MVMLMEDNKVIKIIKELIPYVVILIIVLVLRTYVFTPIKVNGTSMVPTLDGGDFMLLTKYNKNDLNRDDIVIVTIDHGDAGKEDIIKRIGEVRKISKLETEQEIEKLKKELTHIERRLNIDLKSEEMEK